MKKLILFLLMFTSSHASWADFQVATGTITTPTVTGNASVTGLSFTPKLIILYSTSVSSLTGGINQGFGVCQSSAKRWTAGIGQLQNSSAAGTQYQRVFKSTECLNVISVNSTPAAVTYLESDLVSMDSGGFTLNWTTVQASGIPVYYIALGGTDLQVNVGTFDSIATTGSQSITGVGFKPKTVLISNTISTTTEGTAAANIFNIGTGESSTERMVMALFGNNDANFTTDQGSGQLSTAIIQRIGNNLVTGNTADLTSLDADGFTINFSVNASSRRSGYLALAGINAKTGKFNQLTSTGNSSVTGLGFQPSIELFYSRGLVSSTTNDQDFSASIGCAINSTNRNVISMSGIHNNGASINGMDSSSSKAIQFINAVGGVSTPTLQADADFVSQDSGGFTINWTTADATAREVVYLALGAITANTNTFFGDLF